MDSARCRRYRGGNATRLDSQGIIMHHRLQLALPICLALWFSMSTISSLSSADEPPKLLKAGIIGCDTSHVIAFTKELNDPKAEGALAGVRVVAAFPGGSKDVKDSYSRVDGYVKQLQD